MEQLVSICVNNGLGVASFIALIVFIFKYQAKANETLDKINDSLISLNERVAVLEKKEDK